MNNSSRGPRVTAADSLLIMHGVPFAYPDRVQKSPDEPVLRTAFAFAGAKRLRGTTFPRTKHRFENVRGLRSSHVPRTARLYVDGYLSDIYAQTGDSHKRTPLSRRRLSNTDPADTRPPFRDRRCLHVECSINACVRYSDEIRNLARYYEGTSQKLATTPHTPCTYKYTRIYRYTNIIIRG